MRILRATRLLARSGDRRRGAALMLSLLVLFVLVAIVFQIHVATSTDARVARNDLTLTSMDLAIESALLEVFETLKADAEAEAGSGGGGGDGGMGGLGDLGGGLPGDGGGGLPGEGGGAVDSRNDDWARVVRTEINGIRLRILVQDENSKLNVLSMLTEDEGEARKALDRVARVLDFFRGGTEADLDAGQARRLAEAMLRHMENRASSMLPRPRLLSDDDERRDRGLPLSLREFVVLEGFHPDLFRDYRDENGRIVHSLESFLTVWTSIETRQSAMSEGGGAGGVVAQGGGDDGEGDVPQGVAGETGPQGAGGGGAAGPAGERPSGAAVNLNTAPPVVLKALVDDRDIPLRVWDRIIEIRNEEDEDALGDEVPPLDEFGEEIVPKRIFESLSELREIDSWRNLEPIVQAEAEQLLTLRSEVFSIYVTARKPTGRGRDAVESTKEEIVAAEESGDNLLRTVRCTVWRRPGNDGFTLVPLERWEVLDSMPYEVLDFPEKDR